jgi:hypothetical protein
VYNEKENLVVIKVVCCNPEKIKQKLICKGCGCIKSVEIKKETPPPPPPKKKDPPPPPPPVKKDPPPPPPPPPEKKVDCPPPPKPVLSIPVMPFFPSFGYGVCCGQCYGGGPCLCGCGGHCNRPEKPPPCHCGCGGHCNPPPPPPPEKKDPPPPPPPVKKDPPPPPPPEKKVDCPPPPKPVLSIPVMPFFPLFGYGVCCGQCYGGGPCHCGCGGHCNRPEKPPPEQPPPCHCGCGGHCNRPEQPPPPPPPVHPTRSCCGPCSEGRPGGPCHYEGCGRPVYDSYSGGYYCQENPSGCTTM